MSNAPYYNQNTSQPEIVVVGQPQLGIVQSPLPANGQHHSVNIICPYCQRQGITRVEYHNNCKVWLWFVILLCVFFPICWLPFVRKQCKTCDSYCSFCSHLVGTTSKKGRKGY